jgi:mannose-1-phosphate guanylyltransferase/mannose-1-phosphate guanylyltransferase/mannose-6-phosphate isomerase
LDLESIDVTRIRPIILCGGAGTRLWPVSTDDHPKPILALAGAETLLETTLHRVADRDLFETPMVVASEIVAQMIEERGLADDAIIIAEPVARNTAPAVGLAAYNCEPDDILLVLPSDHMIKDSVTFQAAIGLALAQAEQDWFITFGVPPNRPESGYGYIKAGAPIGPGIFAASGFVEKPVQAEAQKLLDEGNHFWNAGIFLFRAGAMIEALCDHAPEIASACQSAVREQVEAGRRRTPSYAPLARCPAISLDFAVIEKVTRLAVVPTAIGWSDLGSWESLYEAEARHTSDNILAGRVLAREVTGCLIRSEGPLIAALGLRDLVVIATDEAVLILPRSQSQRVRELVEAIAASGMDSPQV